MRTSKYKNKIIELFEKNHILSMSEISKKIPEANFSTIFRNIEKLVEDKILKKISVSKDIIRYEKLDLNHHNHFVCEDCGQIDEIELTIASGSKHIHDVLVKGVCEDCHS